MKPGRAVILIPMGFGALALAIVLWLRAGEPEAVDPEVRYRAAFAIGRFGERGRSAIPFLVRALSDPDKSVRWAATNSLGQIAPEVFEEGKGAR